MWLNELFQRLYVVYASELLDETRAEMYDKDEGYRDAVHTDMMGGMVKHLMMARDNMSASGRRIVQFIKRLDPRTRDYNKRSIVEGRVIVLREPPLPPRDSRPDNGVLGSAFADLWTPNAGINFPDKVLDWGRFE